MTPTLALFVADGGDPQNWDDIVAAVLAALSAEFTVTPERTVAGAVGVPAVRVTWLDTFDWRLHKAGLTLENVPGRSGSELRASSPSGLEAAQQVTGWRLSRPHLLADLAGGAVGVRVASLIGVRALMPMVATSTATDVYRLLNEDDKTVAKLIVDRPALDGARKDPLPPRLAIADVRGYAGPARRAARLLAAVPGGTTSMTGARSRLTPAARRSVPQFVAAVRNVAVGQVPCVTADGIVAKPGPESCWICPPSWLAAMKKRTPPVSDGASSCIAAVWVASRAVPALLLLSSSDPKWYVCSAAVSCGPAVLPSTPTTKSCPTRWARLRRSSISVTHAPAGEPVVGAPPADWLGCSVIGPPPAVPAIPFPGTAAVVSAGTAWSGVELVPVQPTVTAQAAAAAHAAAYVRHRLLPSCTPRL